MSRFEYLPAIFRGPDGRIMEVPYPTSEPDTYGVSADLYCPSYEIVKGLWGPPKLGHLDVTIFNTRTYRPDPELAEIARTRLVDAIVAKEGAAVVTAAGGRGGIRQRIEIDTFWSEPRAP